jgi:streptomycin 6-kinase
MTCPGTGQIPGRPAAGDIVLPQSFLDMPRWWSEGTEWLTAAPRLVRAQCAKWNLDIAGGLAHGSNAIVVPVVRDGEPFALRMTPPEPEVAEQVQALRFWDGRGTVRLHEADIANGAMLLERLSMDQSLISLPAAEAIRILAQVMRRLAVPAPRQVRSTAELVRTRSAEFEPEWQRLGRPFPHAILTGAMDSADRLSQTRSDLAVNGDLHSRQVLRGSREPWLTVDPVLLRGDIEYDLARALWTRIDEMSEAAEIVECFETAVAEAELDAGRARDWVLFRTVDYWLWGVGVGLTSDLERCHRLFSAVLA